MIKYCSLLLGFLTLSGLPAFGQWTSVDSGTTNNLNGIYLLDSGVGYAVGDGGTILKTTDAGATWNALSSGSTRTLYDVYFFDDSVGVTVGDRGTILRTTDGGTSWVTITSGVRDTLQSVSFSGTNGICGGTSQDILYSSDSGATWAVAQKGFFGGGFPGAHMVNATTGFVGGQNSIFQPMLGTSTDGGHHWNFSVFYFNSNEGSGDDVFFFDPNTGVMTGVVWDGSGAISRTTDGGTNWTTTLFPNGLQGLDFPTATRGFVSGWLGTIMRSDDAGVSWSNQTSGTSSDLHDVHFASDGETGVAVGASGTILRTSNGGEANSLELVSASSRLGGFAIDLPLDGSGIECRSDSGPDGLPNHHYYIVLTFSNDLSSLNGVTTSCGTVQGFRMTGGNPRQVIVSLTDVTCNAERVTVTATGIQDQQGNTLDSAEVTMGLLLGDVNGDSKVDTTDLQETKLARGQQSDENNFRKDINANGKITAADVRLVRGKIGTMLPP